MSKYPSKYSNNYFQQEYSRRVYDITPMRPASHLPQPYTTVAMQIDLQFLGSLDSSFIPGSNSLIGSSTA